MLCNSNGCLWWGLYTLKPPPPLQPCCQSLNSELRLRLDARRATWWRRACDFNLASQKYPTLTQHRHRGGWEEEAEHLTSIAGGGVGRGAFLECLALRLLSSSVTAHPRDARPCFCGALFPRLTCDPFVRLAVTVVRVAGKVQRVQRADAARAICTGKEGHRRKDQYTP